MLYFRYPGEMAWQLDFDRKFIRNSATLKKLHQFMISETESVRLPYVLQTPCRVYCLDCPQILQKVCTFNNATTYMTGMLYRVKIRILSFGQF